MDTHLSTILSVLPEAKTPEQVIFQLWPDVGQHRAELDMDILYGDATGEFAMDIWGMLGFSALHIFLLHKRHNETLKWMHTKILALHEAHHVSARRLRQELVKEWKEPLERAIKSAQEAARLAVQAQQSSRPVSSGTQTRLQPPPFPVGPKPPGASGHAASFRGTIGQPLPPRPQMPGASGRAAAFRGIIGRPVPVPPYRRAKDAHTLRRGRSATEGPPLWLNFYASNVFPAWQLVLYTDAQRITIAIASFFATHYEIIGEPYRQLHRRPPESRDSWPLPAISGMTLEMAKEITERIVRAPKEKPEGDEAVPALWTLLDGDRHHEALRGKLLPWIDRPLVESSPESEPVDIAAYATDSLSPQLLERMRPRDRTIIALATWYTLQYAIDTSALWNSLSRAYGTGWPLPVQTDAETRRRLFLEALQSEELPALLGMSTESFQSFAEQAALPAGWMASVQRPTEHRGPASHIAWRQLAKAAGFTLLAITAGIGQHLFSEPSTAVQPLYSMPREQALNLTGIQQSLSMLKMPGMDALDVLSTSLYASMQSSLSPTQLRLLFPEAADLPAAEALAGIDAVLEQLSTAAEALQLDAHAVLHMLASGAGTLPALPEDRDILRQLGKEGSPIQHWFTPADAHGNVQLSAEGTVLAYNLQRNVEAVTAVVQERLRLSAVAELKAGPVYSVQQASGECLQRADHVQLKGGAQVSIPRGYSSSHGLVPSTLELPPHDSFFQVLLPKQFRRRVEAPGAEQHLQQRMAFAQELAAQYGLHDQHAYGLLAMDLADELLHTFQVDAGSLNVRCLHQLAALVPEIGPRGMQHVISLLRTSPSIPTQSPDQSLLARLAVQWQESDFQAFAAGTLPAAVLRPMPAAHQLYADLETVISPRLQYDMGLRQDRPDGSTKTYIQPSTHIQLGQLRLRRNLRVQPVLQLLRDNIDPRTAAAFADFQREVESYTGGPIPIQLQTAFTQGMSELLQLPFHERGLSSYHKGFSRLLYLFTDSAKQAAEEAHINDTLKRLVMLIAELPDEATEHDIHLALAYEDYGSAKELQQLLLQTGKMTQKLYIA